MTQNLTPEPYSRPLTNIERMFMWSPYSIVTLLVRLRGRVNERTLQDAVDKVSLRHPQLRSRIVRDGSDLMLTTEGAGGPWVQSIPRQSEQHWLRAVEESVRMPFDFGAQPPIRFLLLESSRNTDIVILCHHIICDGLSLVNLARDLLGHLANPALAVEPLPESAPLSEENMPEGVSLNAMEKMGIGRVNSRWEKERMIFDQEDYRSLHRAYWMRFRHRVLTVAWDEEETAALVERCRAHEVAVNTALTMAFVAAQVVVLGAQPFHEKAAVAVDLRERLPQTPGPTMGFYAGLARPRARYESGRGFWENAARLHSTLEGLYDDKHLFEPLLTWCALDPTILEAMPFKRLASVLQPGVPRYARLASFGRRDDTVLSLLKRDEMATLKDIVYGTAVTNLGSVEGPWEQGTLAVERMVLKPGGGFPLANVNLVVGAVTVNDRLSLAIEYVEDNVDTATMEKIRDQALAFLRE